MGDKLTRRAALACLGSGAVVMVTRSYGFESVAAGRDVSVAVSRDSSALLGISNRGPVKKNHRSAMVEYTNNSNESFTITTTLDTCSDGTLYDNDGGSGCSVTTTLAPGNSQPIDISASATGTITYGISVSSASLDIETSGSVESQAGNVKGAVRIKKPSKNNDFTADWERSTFEVDVDIEDDDGDDDLDRIEYRVREGGSGGNVVGSKDVTNPPGGRYRTQGSDTESISPESGESVQSGTTYALTVTAYDADGNSASETVEGTA
ncbi:MAG: hypothetical protein ABEJ26_03285 [Halosimplex sp.]